MPDPDVYFEPTETKASYGDKEPEPGVLLKEGKSEKAVAKAALELWETKDDLMDRRMAQWRVNELRRSGVKNVQLRRESDDRSWKAWTPPHLKGRPDAITAMNKAATLCRKFSARMFADPPAPDAVPATGEDEDKDAADFTNRALEDEQSQSKLADIKQHRRAFDRASTFGSGFIRYYVHPTAGGRMPLQISASPQAVSVDDALEDPETGLPWPDLTERFVMEDGTLTDEQEEAAFRFLPALKSEVLTGRNVRMIPHTAEDIWEAEGVQVAAFRPWGELRQQFEELDKVPEEERATLFGFRPERYEYVATAEERRTLDVDPDDEDEKLVFTLTTYYKQGTDYPKGACVVSICDKYAPEKREWTETDSEGREISLPLPITQHKQWSEGTDDPYGFGLMDIVGEGNEIRSWAISALQDNVEAILNRHVFLPMNSVLQPKDLRLPGRTPIYINPGGAPVYETVPTFPKDGMNLYDKMDKEMEDDSGMGATAQGLESPQVQSGRHAQAIAAQAMASASDVRQNAEDAYLRACQIQIALIRAFYDAPRRIGWVGEDGAYKEQRWAGTDMRATSDVKLKPGTMSMLTPVQKTMLADQYFQTGVLRQDDYAEIVLTNMGATVGMHDNPYRMRIRRQIHKWLEGPPEGWQPEMQDQPVIDPATGQPQVDQQTGQPMMQQVQVVDQVLGGIFRPYPQDDLPFVARRRLEQLARAMSKSDFAIQPEPWQFGMIQEFNRAQAAQQAAAGMQVGQPPNVQQSPAQKTDGQAAEPTTPVPDDTGAIAQ